MPSVSMAAQEVIDPVTQAHQNIAMHQLDAKHDYFAWVGDEKIGLNEFQSAVQAGIRKRFYHGKVPEDKLLAYRKEVAQLLVDRALLLQEAKRNGIVFDVNEVNKNIADYAARYAKSDYWQKNKTQLLPGLRSAIEEENLLQHLERKVKNVAPPEASDVKAFYQERSDFFTTPERIRVSLIMLKVDPSSSGEIWQAATIEAEDIVKRIRKGADFADLAKIHSGDKTASQGGDMGFIHEGMLAAPAQKIVVSLKPGEVSDPLILLQGVAVLKLTERQPPTLNKYADVAERARQLLQRQRADNAWESLLLSLRESVNIAINPALALQ